MTSCTKQCNECCCLLLLLGIIGRISLLHAKLGWTREHCSRSLADCGRGTGRVSGSSCQDGVHVNLAGVVGDDVDDVLIASNHNFAASNKRRQRMNTSDNKALNNNNNRNNCNYNKQNQLTNLDSANELWHNETSEIGVDFSNYSSRQLNTGHGSVSGRQGRHLSTAIAASNQQRNLKRHKRYLLFMKGARASLRITSKNNIIPFNTLFQYAFGSRINYPLPTREDEAIKILTKRDVFQGVIDAFDRHGFDGAACLLKSYCTVKLDRDTDISGGMLFKLLNQMFRFDPHVKRHFPFLKVRNCYQLLHHHCPLSFNGISTFTDVF